MVHAVQLAQSGPLFAIGGAMIFFWILGLIATIFWIWMLIDCLTSSLATPEKVLWFCVIFFLHVLGALIYFFVARTGGRHRLAT